MYMPSCTCVCTCMSDWHYIHCTSHTASNVYVHVPTTVSLSFRSMWRFLCSISPLAQDMQGVPPHVVNHGILPSTELQKLLAESKVFVGLGFPYDGGLQRTQLWGVGALQQETLYLMISRMLLCRAWSSGGTSQWLFIHPACLQPPSWSQEHGEWWWRKCTHCILTMGWPYSYIHMYSVSAL